MVEVPVVLRGLRDVASRYDVVLFDQFGVLHDGTKALPGAVEAIEKLQALSVSSSTPANPHPVKMVIVSNSSSRKAATRTRYLELGFPDHMCDYTTSGELTHAHLSQTYSNKKALWCAWHGYEEDSYLAGCGVGIATSVEDADVLLFHGSQCIASPLGPTGSPHLTGGGVEGGGRALAVYEKGPVAFDEHIEGSEETLRHIFQLAAQRGLPAVCANPDLLAVRDTGRTAHMPGRLADLYDHECGRASAGAGAARRRGGAGLVPLTLRFGKPAASHFHGAIAAAVGEPYPSLTTTATTTNNNRSSSGMGGLRVLHVGDSLHHDIQGAADAGVDSLLITDYGVHKDSFLSTGVAAGTQGTERADLLHSVTDLCDSEGVPRPTFILPALQW